MERANRVLELLYDHPSGHVGAEELAAAAGIDRAGVERALNRLAACGHRFERTPMHGIRLIRPTVLDAGLIERDLAVEQIGRRVICLGEVDSTNDAAFGLAGESAGGAVVVTAESQRAGRGRGGSRWLSPPGSGVLASVLLHDRACTLAPEALTIAAGLAVAEGVEAGAGLAPALQWPNDVVIDDAKVAGVIVEVRSPRRGRRVVIGVGVNVNAAPPPEAVDRAVACLADAAGHGLERIEICRSVLARLDAWVSALLAGRTEDLHQRWCAYCRMINQRVRVASAGETFTGRVLDVSPLEGLVLLTDAGRRVHLPAAVTTVLPAPKPAP